VWRQLHVAFLLLVLGCTASADDSIAECGTVLSVPIHDDTIYVLCPSLSGLSKDEAYNVIETVLRQTSRRAGDTRLIFLSDPAVLDREWQYQDMQARLASWGDIFVGMYHTSSGLLKYRSSTDGKWRNIHLGIS
jgi:hypothetical protein